MKWSRRWELNPQPAAYEAAALPIELRRRLEVTAGFEPANKGFADPCLGPLGYVTMAERVGFEPTRGKPLPVFKTGAINRSATSPANGSGGRTRTFDLLIQSQPPYQLGHPGMVGAPGEIRTHDLQVRNLALSSAELRARDLDTTFVVRRPGLEPGRSF
jgi:hypothetical protein